MQLPVPHDWSMLSGTYNLLDIISHPVSRSYEILLCVTSLDCSLVLPSDWLRLHCRLNRGAFCSVIGSALNISQVKANYKVNYLSSGASGPWGFEYFNYASSTFSVFDSWRWKFPVRGDGSADVHDFSFVHVIPDHTTWMQYLNPICQVALISYLGQQLWQ